MCFVRKHQVAKEPLFLFDKIAGTSCDAKYSNSLTSCYDLFSRSRSIYCGPLPTNAKLIVSSLGEAKYVWI